MWLYRRYIRHVTDLRFIRSLRLKTDLEPLHWSRISISSARHEPDPARERIRDPQQGATGSSTLQREAHFTLQTASQQVMLARSVANLQVCSRAESDVPSQQRKTLLIKFTFANIHERGEKKKRSQTVAWSPERRISPGVMLSQLSTHQITLCLLIL